MFTWINLGKKGLGINDFGSLTYLAEYALHNVGNGVIRKILVHKGQTINLTPPLTTDPVYTYSLKVDQSGLTAKLTLTPRHSDSAVKDTSKEGEYVVGPREEILGPKPLIPAVFIASARTMRVYHFVWISWDLALEVFSQVQHTPN